MAEPGWYPDPEGAPGRYRYFDGRQWAAETVDAPPQRRRRLLIIGAAALAAVLIIATVVILVRPDRGAVPDAHPPPPAETGWDDSGNSPTPTPPSASESPGRGPSPSAKPSAIRRPSAHCPTGEPEKAVEHAGDGRVHGGQLSYPAVSGHGFGKPRVDDHYRWWYDEHTQTARLTDGAAAGRTARVAIGSVAIKDDYRTVAQAAKSSLRCVIGTDDYSGYTGQHTVENAKVRIDGQSGRELITDVTVRTDNDKAITDRIRLIVVDAGAPGSFSIFVGVAPTDDSARSKIIRHTAGELKIGY